MSEWADAISRIRTSLSTLEQAAILGDDRRDAAGEIRAVERRLAVLRKNLNDELLAEADPASGETMWLGALRRSRGVSVGKTANYASVVTRKCRRTYRTSAILAGIGERLGLSPTETVLALHREGILRMQWGWLKLRDYAEKHGLEVTTGPGPIDDDGDLDGYWVGEEWSETLHQEPIFEPEEEA